MGITVVVSLQARDGKANEGLAAIRTTQQYCLTLPGCSGFAILQNQADPHRFVFIERWKSLEEHAQVLQTLMSSPDTAEVMKLFSAGPDIEYFDGR
jgi:quinol monooxygenase YgiN